MSTLMVSAYPPERCGIAAYAAQSVRGMRQAGEDVRVLTWGDGQADFHLPHRPLGRRVLDLLPYCRDADRVVLQYVPPFYMDDGSRLGQVASRLAMRSFFRRVPNVEVIVHEQSWYPPVETLSLRGRLLWWLERRQWAAARDLCFHNAAAVDAYRRRFCLPGENARIVAHGRHFVPFYRGSRAEARAALGLPAEAVVFTSVGFVVPYKGYETVIEALALRPGLPCRYYIVGDGHPDTLERDRAYIDRLCQAAGADSRVRFHLEYVDDRLFDTWIRAADAVLLPYHSSTSSGVLARCHILGTPACVSRQAPGLEVELGPGDRAASDAEELAGVLEEWCSE